MQSKFFLACYTCMTEVRLQVKKNHQKSSEFMFTELFLLVHHHRCCWVGDSRPWAGSVRSIISAEFANLLIKMSLSLRI